MTVNATVYYVRQNGSNSTNCTGQADADYDGSGTGEACAYSHPFYWTGWWGDGSISSGGVAPSYAGGDDLVISCNDQKDCTGVTFNVGYDSSWSGMSASWTYGGYMRPIKDGSSGNHTKIKGCDLTNGCSSASKRPGFTGFGRNQMNINLQSSDYVDIEDIDVYDTATCGSGHASYGCGSADDAEASVRDNINITNATNITIKNSKIYGAYRAGVYGGGGSDIVFDNADISYNSFVGWDGDSCGGAGTCGIGGSITFQNGSKVTYNGCVMSGTLGTISSEGCYSQDQTGYGDGIGMGETGGTWIFNDTDISHNVSDGLDLLYCNRGSYSGCTVTIRRSRFEGNAGNQVKVPNDTDIQASVVISNCGYFYRQSGNMTLYEKNNTGRSGSGCNNNAVCESSENSTDCKWVDANSNGVIDVGEGDCPAFNNCRSSGNALVFAFHTNNSPIVYGNTIIGNSDVLIENSGTCAAGTDDIIKNNILIGGREFNDDTGINAGGGNDSTSIYFDDDTGSCDTDFIETNNLCFGFKEGTNACNGSGSNDSTGTFANTFTGTLPLGPLSSPGYYQGTNGSGQLVLKTASTAIDMADSSVSGSYAYDFNAVLRSGTWDAGALEFVSSGGSSTPPTTSMGGVIITLGGGKISQ